MKQSRVATSMAGLALLMSASVHAAGIFDGGGLADTKYETALNWDDDIVPTGIAVTMGIGGIVTFDATTGTRTATTATINGGTVLNLSGGTLNPSTSGNTTRTNIGFTTPGTLNQSGGTFSPGHVLRIGSGASGTGIYNLSGGALIVSRGSNSLIGAPSVVVGGNFGPSISLGSGGSVGTLDITGGSVITRAGVEISTTGNFKVSGTGATSILIGAQNTDSDGRWYQQGTLTMGIGATGITKIDLRNRTNGTTSTPYAEFTATSKLDLSFFGTAPYAGTWTLFEIQNFDIIDGGLSLTTATLADPNWSFAIDNTGANGLLTATYVPEPTSFALALGGLGLLVLRRRRA